MSFLSFSFISLYHQQGRGQNKQHSPNHHPHHLPPVCPTRQEMQPNPKQKTFNTPQSAPNKKTAAFSELRFFNKN
jgi:hypothetical protein